MPVEGSLRDGYPWPNNLPRGDCTIISLLDAGGTQTGVRIDHADPCILISGELLDAIASKPPPHARLDTTGCTPPPYRATYTGAVLRIEAVNRTVVYRMSEYIPAVHGYIAEWPD